jgi:asparagine synthase (glutamine-hydrolysing)
VAFVGHWAPFLAIANIVEKLSGDIAQTVDRSAGSMIVVGHCLATAEQLDKACEAMLSAGDICQASNWPGCYSIVLITRRGVTLLADPVGQFPLYVANAGDTWWFGSSAASIARQVRAKPDPVSLTVTLMCPESWDLSRRRSMFRDIKQVAEGHTVSIGSSGLRYRAHDALLPDPDLGFGDCADRLRSALSTAVSARVARSERLTADLSGGLDSTSLAFLAARHVPELPVLFSYNPHAPVEDDLVRAREYVRSTSGLRFRTVPITSDHLPYQVVGPMADAPHASSLVTGMLRSRLASAVELGSDLHMVGEGGDVLLSAPPAYLADLARRGDIAGLWRGCVAWARIRARSPIALFQRALSLGVNPRRKALRAFATSLENNVTASESSWEVSAIGYWPPPPTHWLTRKAQMNLAIHARDTAERLFADDLGVGDVVSLGQLRQNALSQQVVRNTGTEVGVAVHAPFLDTAVVKACLSLPTWRRADPAISKPLLRAALPGLVPNAVLSRTTKGDYTRSAHQGIKRAAPTFRRMLAESVAADHGLIEPRPVREALEKAVNGMPTNWGQLNQVLATEVWLRHHEQGFVA